MDPYDADYYSSTEEEDDTSDEEEERDETDYFFSKSRSSKELDFILEHAVKHPPHISAQEFICALCYDRLSPQWNEHHENLYQEILINLVNA